MDIVSKELFNQICDRLLQEWPESINTKEKDVSSEISAHIPEFEKVYDPIEDNLHKITEFSYDDIEQIDWAMRTVLHLDAIKHDVTYPHKVDREKVFKIYIRNLEDLRKMGVLD